MTVLGAVFWALPWIVIPLVVLRRAAQSRTLAEESATLPIAVPMISVIVPARNEQQNIDHCMRSILATTYPVMELIVVDDHSSDDTAAIARRIAESDARVRVIENPDLPDGWFGKQWACATGAEFARGDLLCFTDADTTHAPDLLARASNAMRKRSADLLSVAGKQEMHTFWERLLQPQVFFVLIMRFGSTEAVSSARRAEDVIANGQFILVRREPYEQIGGHSAVRNKVAEDMALAQQLFRAGKRVVLVAGTEQLATRMYSSLGDLVRGWGKNVYAGGREAMPGGALGRAVFPLVLLLTPIAALAPVLTLALGLAGVVSSAWTLWAAIATAACAGWWALVYRESEQTPWYALAYPLGMAVLAYIMVGAIARGDRVAWKGRSYVAK